MRLKKLGGDVEQGRRTGSDLEVGEDGANPRGKSGKMIHGIRQLGRWIKIRE